MLKIVRAVNVGTTPFREMSDGETYLIQPGSDTLVPYDAAVLWFGNPDAIDLDARRRDRTDEYGRIRTRYGVYEHDERWDANVPKIEVYTLEGERVYMVADDPEGIRRNPVAENADTLAGLQAQLIAQQQQQQRILEALAKNPDAAAGVLAAMKGENTADATPDDFPSFQPGTTLPPDITDDSGNPPASPASPTPAEPSTSQQSSTPPTDAPTRIKVS